MKKTPMTHTDTDSALLGIKVRLKHGAIQVTQALVTGNLAVHAGFGPKSGSYVITFRQAGAYVPGCGDYETEADALYVAEALEGLVGWDKLVVIIRKDRLSVTHEDGDAAWHEFKGYVPRVVNAVNDVLMCVRGYR
jgi:hypothetical protein